MTTQVTVACTSKYTLLPQTHLLPSGRAPEEPPVAPELSLKLGRGVNREETACQRHSEATLSLMKQFSEDPSV